VFVAVSFLVLSAVTSAVSPTSPIVVVGFTLADNADDDGFADSNETVALRLVLFNRGDSDLTNVVARLTSADLALACPTRAVIVIPLLAAGETRAVREAFEFRVDDRQRTGACSIGGAPCASSASCGAGTCNASLVDFAATLRVTFSSDQLPAISAPQSVRIELDLDAVGGSGATTFFEGFESGSFGSFTPQNLDQGKYSFAGSDGYRCQYHDPAFLNSNSWGVITDCFLGATAAQADALHWQIDGPSSPYPAHAYSGQHSLYMGMFLPDGRGNTTPLATLEAVASGLPIHLGVSRVCEATRTTPCATDADCPASESCVGVTPTLSIKHQISLMDDRSINAPPGRATDRAVVQAQVTDATGQPVTDWLKLEPYLNVYDTQAADNYFNCTFDPIDDGNTEDDFYDPTDPYRRLGPSSTCFPERSFAFQGATDGAFDAERIGRASDGPGLGGATGPGTWIESRFDLSAWRGRSLRLRFLATAIKAGTYASWDDGFHFNPGQPGDDGWWIDDVTLTDTLVAPAVLVADTADNSGFPELPDGDGDASADACDNCPLAPNADQEDADGDLLGDLCDACPLDPDDDADEDGLCCDVDNCCDVPNPDQEDADGDGAGDLCDIDPVITVSADPLVNASYRTIQQAVDFAPQSGTRVRILPGTYVEQVQIDRDMVFYIDGADDGSGEPVIVDGTSDAAFHLVSTAGRGNATLRNLTIRGAFGAISEVPITIEDCVFEQNSVNAIDLSAPSSVVRRVTATSPTTRQGIWLRPSARALIENVRLQNMALSGLYLEGEALVRNALIAYSGYGILVDDPGAVLHVEHSTIADNANGDILFDTTAVSVVSTIVQGWADGECSFYHGSILTARNCSAVNGNLFADPQLTEDYHLSPTSPALDRGGNPALFDGVPCTDLDGGPRLRDHDGNGLAEMDIGAFERASLLRPTPAAEGLTWTSKQKLSWSAAPSATEYHVHRGALADLGFDDYGTCRDDLKSGATELTDSALPPPGSGFFYLVTFEGAQVGSTLGLGTCAERSNFAPCP
jgi:hypothetical protein